MADEAFSYKLEPGAYAFGEPAAIKVVGSGGQTHLWVGLANANRSCLGVLDGTALVKMAEEILRRTKGSKQISKTPGTTSGAVLGRTAAPTKSFRSDGRRRG